MVYKNKNKTNVEGWEEQMGKFPSKPSFFPIFSPIWGEKKKHFKMVGPRKTHFIPSKINPPTK